MSKKLLSLLLILSICILGACGTTENKGSDAEQAEEEKTKEEEKARKEAEKDAEKQAKEQEKEEKRLAKEKEKEEKRLAKEQEKAQKEKEKEEKKKQKELEKAEKEKEKQRKKLANYNQKINEKLEFDKFYVEIRKIKVKEKKGEFQANLDIVWWNKDYDYGYPEKTLYTSTLFEVKQGDTVLNEVDDKWNVENKHYSSIFDPVKINDSQLIALTYKLKDGETPIDLYFTPTTETEGTKKYTIKLLEE